MSETNGALITCSSVNFASAGAAWDGTRATKGAEQKRADGRAAIASRHYAFDKTEKGRKPAAIFSLGSGGPSHMNLLLLRDHLLENFL